MSTKPLTFRGWLALLASFCILTVAFSFGLFSLPVFYPMLVKAFGWNRASATAGGSIVLLLIGILSPVVGWLVDKFTPKAVLVGGMCLVALSLALLSMTQSLTEYYAFCLLLGAGTSAVSIMPNSLLIGPWFGPRRGLAVGFINAGIGLGQFIAPNLTAGQIAARGISGTFLVLSACLAIPLILTLLAVTGKSHPEGRSTARTAAIHVPKAGELFRMPMYWIFGVSLFFAAHAMIAIQQNLVLYLSGEGVSVKRAALAASVAGGAAALGKLLSGAISDKFSARLAMMLSIVCVGLGIAMLLSIAPRSDLIFGFAIVFGMGYGGIFNASPTIVFEYFGPHQVGTVLGLIYIFFGLGTASGGLLAGYLFDRTHSYSVPFALDLALACAGLVLLLVSGRQTKRAPMPAKAVLSTS
jgi:MFS family permease